jgi:anti-sigma regulatory factor (Ser/Thr protein kinase)
MPIACNGHCAESGGVPSFTARTCAVDLTCDLAAPRTARRLVVLVLRQWGVVDEEVLDGASIVVSELVTNVLMHCDDGGPMRVDLALDDQGVTVAVVDHNPVVPAQRTAGEADENGRGLSIIGQLAARWEVQPLSGGKRVAASLPVQSAWSA